jgi:hypothetical protein
MIYGHFLKMSIVVFKSDMASLWISSETEANFFHVPLEIITPVFPFM